jgi:uncharacterized RDD family membrane protein YckC
MTDATPLPHHINEPRHTSRDALDTRMAGIVSRGVAAAIDAVVVIVIVGSIYLFFYLLGLLFSTGTFNAPNPNIVLSGIASYSIAVIYMTTCWMVSGRTVGSVAMGLEVVSRDGSRLGPSRSLLRALFYAFFPIGLAWVAVHRRRLSVQDMVLRTRVVYAW